MSIVRETVSKPGGGQAVRWVGQDGELNDLKDPPIYVMTTLSIDSTYFKELVYVLLK